MQKKIKHGRKEIPFIHFFPFSFLHFLAGKNFFRQGGAPPPLSSKKTSLGSIAFTNKK
jgi:hypothetical protein